MAPEQRTTIVLLAGGSASRLPGKLALPVDGEPMLERVFRRLTTGGRPCIISVRAPLTGKLGAAALAPVVVDEMPGGGPLVGLVSAAATVTTPLFFAAAGDLPNIDADFVGALEAAFDRAESPIDAVVPTWPDGKVEPLAALYRTDAFLASARAGLAAGNRKVAGAFDTLRIVRFSVRAGDEVRLANVNTPADYDRLRA